LIQLSTVYFKQKKIIGSCSSQDPLRQGGRQN